MCVFLKSRSALAVARVSALKQAEELLEVRRAVFHSAVDRALHGLQQHQRV